MTTLHTLRRAPGTQRSRKRVGCGRGSGRGKTCGRGHKGQYARAGHKHKLGFEGGQMRLLRRVPKRGFNRPYARRYRLVNLADLNRFEEGSEITAAVLEKAGLVAPGKEGIKLLGKGDLQKKLHVKLHACSATARAAVIKAGGTADGMD